MKQAAEMVSLSPARLAFRGQIEEDFADAHRPEVVRVLALADRDEPPRAQNIQYLLVDDPARVERVQNDQSVVDGNVLLPRAQHELQIVHYPARNAAALSRRVKVRVKLPVKEFVIKGLLSLLESISAMHCCT